MRTDPEKINLCLNSGIDLSFYYWVPIFCMIIFCTFAEKNLVKLKRMKVSKYTFFIEKQGIYCLYNTFSNSLISVDKILFDCLKNFSGKKQFKEEELNEDADNIALLKKGKFITDNDMDDFLQIKYMLNAQRNDINYLGLTIAPTMDCNYNCFYCFEEHHPDYMTSEEIQAIIRHIEQKKDIKGLSVTWFGGEPLMALDRIKEFYQDLKSPTEHVSSQIITNGYYMTPDVVEFFKENKFNSVQISIDGIGDDYNKVKYSKTNSNCWDTVLKNMDYLLTQSKIQTNIRVNIQKDDTAECMKILQFFRTRYPNHKHLYIVPVFIMENQLLEQKTEYINQLIGKKEKIEFDLELSKIMLDNNMGDLGQNYPPNAVYECGSARNVLRLSIGPGGKLYKCWEIMGNEEHCYGVLEADGSIKVTNFTVLNRYLHAADPLLDPKCQKCKFLPICAGGCPYKRIRNLYEKTNIEICTDFKTGFDDYLGKRIEQYIKQKKN